MWEINVIAVGTTLLAIAFSIWLLEALVISRPVAGEPPYIRPKIPIIGHLSILKEATAYSCRIAKDQPAGIFTLPIPFFNIYIVTDRTLITALQRTSRTISFLPFSKQANKVLAKLSDKTMQCFEDPTFNNQVKHLLTQSLMSGDHLDRLNLETITAQTALLNDLTTQTTPLPLSSWTRHLVTLTVSRGIYGPQNPFTSPTHYANFWTFHRAAPVLLLNLLPSLFARPALRAQNALIASYKTYHALNGHHAASHLEYHRRHLLLSHNFTPTEASSMPLAFDFAAYPNYAPTAFWCLTHLFSSPTLLSAIRTQLLSSGAITIITTTTTDTPTYTLTLSHLKTSCPLLLSLFQETQRLYSIHALIRKVTADTILTNDKTDGGPSHLLRQGRYLQVPAMASLRSPEIWGDNPDEFDAYRFVRMSNKSDSKSGDLSPAAFPVWGIAPHLCPARQFASTGIIALMAQMAMRFDLADEHGELIKPPSGHNSVPSVLMPDSEVSVRVRMRQGWNEGPWEVILGEKGVKTPIAIK